MGKKIITIARQFGAGGREIGKILAKKLNIDFYDKELISIAAKDSGYAETIFEMADEKPTNSFLYSLAMGMHPMNSMFLNDSDIITNDKLFNIQSKAIKKLAQEKDCIIVGRCADYILREEENITRIFLYADLDKRIERVKRLYPEIEEKNVESTIIKTDKKRASYYSYYTGNKWARLENYDLAINTAKMSYDKIADFIIEFSNN